MDAVLLSRLQFAITIGFHFIFAPLTIGLSWLVCWLMTRWLRTGDAAFRDMARFWVNIFALSFAVGVATGITMEFQFGTNWANYSRFVGDIFGAPLAAETITSFFLESVFIGLLLFGWDRVPKTVHWFSSLMVAVGATLSAFWIIAANSFMQTPAGYHLVHGRAELTSFWLAIFNASTLPRFLHTVDGAIMTGAFFMLGISAWLLLHKRCVEPAKVCFILALVVGFLFSAGQIFLGHYHAIQVTYTQPAKMAAIEGIFETQRNAPLLLFGIPDARTETTHLAIRIPGALSFIVSGNTNTPITGLREFPKNQWPPLFLTSVPFHLMIMIGMFLAGFAFLGICLLWYKRLFTTRWYLLLAWFVIPLPFLANELGWMTAEVGRQPWIVYNLQATRDAISVSVPVPQIIASIAMFTLLYALLFVIWLAFLRRAMRTGISETAAIPPMETKG